MIDPLLTRGPDDADYYVLGTAPTQADYEDGTAYQRGNQAIVRFAGFAGLNPERGRFGYIVSEWAPKAPSKSKITDYREAVEEDIVKTAPKVVVFCGHPALHWYIQQPKLLPLSWRGRFFPVKIGSHVCWGLFVLDPSYIQFVFKDNERSIKDYNKLTINDLGLISAISELAPPYRDPEPDIELCTRTAYTDFEEAFEALTSFPSGGRVSTDIETNDLEPWNDRELLTFSVACGDRVVSIPYLHPENTWTPEQKRIIFAAYIDLLNRSSDIVAHNALYELRWLVWLARRAGHPLKLRGGPVWHDTQVLAYLLDSRPQTLNLDSQSIFVWGVRLKALTNLNRKKMIEEPMVPTLVYNGLDTFYTDMLFVELMEDIVAQDLMGIYEKHVDRTVSITEMLQEGVPISEEEANRQIKVSYAKETRLLEELRANPDVIAYVEAKGGKEFNPHSPPMVSALFRNLYSKKKLTNSEGKVSVNKDMLGKLEHPAAKLIVEYRAAHSDTVNLRNWVDPELIEHRDGWMYLHGHFNHALAQTGRLSSQNPNMQNANKHTEFRRIVWAPPGYKLVDVDYRQLEACGIAAVSGDEFFIDALINGLDVHAECTRELQEIAPDFGADMEFSALRSIVKNVWVFPAFYGAHWKSLARYTGLKPAQAEDYYNAFWRRFRGVKRWQNEMLRFYQKNGYIVGPTGRVYREPLRTNQILNYPIQGSCSDLLVESMGTLSSLGLTPCLNVHDELLFCVPEDRVDPAVELIKDVLLNPSSDFDWMTSKVPLGCKISVGMHWDDLETVVDTTKE